MSFTEHRDFPKALALAEQLGDVARRIVREHFRAPITVERKSDGTPVTVADRDIESHMRRMIRAAFPGHAIRGEEFAAEGSGEFTWVLDPIDGTKSFISGYPLFGSLIALQQGDRAVLGVLEAPVVGERWLGADGIRTLFQWQARECQRVSLARGRDTLYHHAGNLRWARAVAFRSAQRPHCSAPLWRRLLSIWHARQRLL